MNLLLNIVFVFFLFQANGTFNSLAMLKELADSWDELGPRVSDFLQNSPQVNTIRVRFNKISRITVAHIFFFFFFFLFLQEFYTVTSRLKESVRQQ